MVEWISSIYKASSLNLHTRESGELDVEKQIYNISRHVSITYIHKKLQLGWFRFAEKRQRGSYIPRHVLDSSLAHTLQLLSLSHSLFLKKSLWLYCQTYLQSDTAISTVGTWFSLLQPPPLERDSGKLPCSCFDIFLQVRLKLAILLALWRPARFHIVFKTENNAVLIIVSISQ